MAASELLIDLLGAILHIRKELEATDTATVLDAKKDYRELLDSFYDKYRDKIAPEQYETAKDDSAYFLALVQLAYHDEMHNTLDIKGDQAPYFNWKLFTQI